MPENRRAYNIQQFANFRVAHIQEVGQKDNVAFPFGQSVKGFGKQFIFDEYIKAGHLKTEIIAFVFVRCEKLREFAFAQIRKSNFACCAFRKSAAVAFRLSLIHIYQARLLQKTALLVGEIIDRYEMKPLWHKEVKKQHVKKLLKKLWRKAEEAKLEFVSGRGKRKEQLQKDIEDLEAALKKINEYEDKLRRCGNRNSYSKTDPDATFMHMKDDHMMNGQLKPAYNIQHAVNSGFIVAVGVYPNPSDVLTLKPFMEQMEASLEFQFERIVADAGYESEENLVFLRDKEIKAYIKPSNYEQLGTKKFSQEIGKKENMAYDREGDFYICHNGKKVEKAGKKTRKTSSGYCREETHYVCRECGGCPYREKCLSGRNWKKPLEKRYKKLIVSRLFEELREEEYRLINSKEGKQLRMNRSIQAEGGFADIKGDSGFTRFLCRGTDNVFAEYVLYAMAQMCIRDSLSGDPDRTVWKGWWHTVPLLY